MDDNATLRSIYQISEQDGWEARFVDGDIVILPAHWHIDCVKKGEYKIKMGSSTKGGIRTKSGMIVDLSVTKNKIDWLIRLEKDRIATDKDYQPGVFIE